jgi:hypothetical protein
LRRGQGERALERRPVVPAKTGGGSSVPPYIGDGFAQPEHRGGRKRAGRRGASVVLGQIELVGGDHRNRSRGEGGLFKLPVEVISADLPLPEGLFEMRGALRGLRSLGELAQIGDVGEVKAGQIVDQVCDVGGVGGVGQVSLFLN